MISDGKIVKIDYTVKVDNQIIDSSKGKDPLEYTHGQNMIIPGLENELKGLKVGDKKTVIVTPKDAYGEVDQKAIIELPRAQLGNEREPQVGMGIQVMDASGKPLIGKIVEIKEATVTVDFNHPLAGKELEFDVEVVAVN